MRPYGKGGMMKKLCAIVVTALSVSLIQGCSESEPDSQDVLTFVQGTWESACYNRSGGGGYKHRIKYEGFDFTIDSLSYQSTLCEGRVSRATRNWMQGKFLPGELILSQDGLQVLEVDYFYGRTDVDKREFFDPSPYEIVYLDRSSGDVFLGMKSRRGANGFAPDRRPTQINFSNVWKKISQ